MADFTDTIVIRGEEYEFDQENMQVLVPCENCGHMNQVDCVQEGDDVVFYGFSCENCGHWNSVD